MNEVIKQLKEQLVKVEKSFIEKHLTIKRILSESTGETIPETDRDLNFIKELNEAISILEGYNYERKSRK